MSSDEQIPVVADVENAKKSDGASTADQHSVDKVNDDEQVPQADEKSPIEKEEDKESETTTTTAAAAAEDNNINGKANNNKRDIDHVHEDDEKKNGQAEEEEDDDEQAVVSTTTATNKKIKISDPLANENGGDTDESSSTSAKVPNEELTVV
ncbi:unnamed protein product [Adineta steineri]|uniref:Uncharacterized protein n=1 Tax=Adineta steineri TaxID=433720 RepID=A0A814ERA3_9BILA|nr:unnamed protein product [Adineta steineri]